MLGGHLCGAGGIAGAGRRCVERVEEARSDREGQQTRSGMAGGTGAHVLSGDQKDRVMGRPPGK